MTRYGLGVFIMVVVVPIMVFSCLVMRPSIMCSIYLGMLLYFPFLNLIDVGKLNTGIFKYIMIFVPYQTGATQLGFYLYTLSTNEILMEENADMLRLLKSLGMSPLQNLDFIYCICWVGPECLMVVVSILYTCGVRMITSKEGLDDNKEDAEKVWRERFKNLQRTTKTGKWLTILCLFFTAMWRHNIFGVCYLAMFLFFMSVWALCKDLSYTLSNVLFFCMPIVMLHTIAIYVYQIEMIQFQLRDNIMLSFRVVGILALLKPYPDYGPDYTHYEKYTSDLLKLFYPVGLYVLYYLMVSEAVLLRSLEKFTMEEKKRLYQKKWKRIKKKKLDVLKSPETLLQSLIGERTKNLFWEHARNTVRAIIAIVVEYSYVGAICAYMLWSVSFLAWTSFALVTLSVILWMLPHQRKPTVYSCYGVVAFSYINIAYTYISGFTDAFEFGKYVGDESSIFKFYKFTRFKTVAVFVKVLLTVMYWVTIRKYLKDKDYKNQALFLSEEAQKRDRTVPERKGRIIENILTYFFLRYWILAIVLFILIWVVTMKVLRIYRILNIFYFLSFMIVLQIDFRFWRKMLIPFLYFLLLMTFINMMIIYMYQFKAIKYFAENTLGFPKDFDVDFGTLIANRYSYYNRLFCSIIIIMMILIQLRFYQAKFMSLTDENNEKAHAKVQKYKVQFGMVFRRYIDLTNFIFLFLEMHSLKVSLLFLFLMCIFDPCAYYFMVLMLSCSSMVFPFRSVRLMVIYASAILVSVFTMSSLIYALNNFKESDYDITCKVYKHPTLNETTRNWVAWVGLKKHDREHYHIITFIVWETAFVLISCLRSISEARQRINRKQQGLPTEMPKVMFPEVTYREADMNLKNYIKYAMNYGFYRMGYEICMTMIVIVIVLRMDAVGILYSVWLCLLLIQKRSMLRWTWIIFVIFVALSILWQYLMVIGAPPFFCIEYEWETRTYYWDVAQDFFFLPDNYRSPPAKKMIAEAILLILASQQMLCFWTEIKNKRQHIDYDGGSNSSIVPHFEKPGLVNPVVDFMTYTTSYLDVAKRIFFNMSYWGCMWIVFLGSVNRNNIFSVIYMCSVFIYLWHGINIYYKPLTVIQKYWNYLIVQNVLIICIKSGLQVIGCFYMRDIPMKYCHLIKLFGIWCLRNFGDPEYFENLTRGENICIINQSDRAGATWDAIIFIFLIIQKRVFCSYNFFHIVNDAKAQHLLSARGAIYLDEMHNERIKKIKGGEDRVREAVKSKLTKFINKKKDIQQEFYKDFVTTHKMAIRSGDYYMYEEYETDVEKYVTFKKIEEERRNKRKKRGHNLISLFGDMFNTDMRTAVRRYWDTSDDKTENKPVEDAEPYEIITRIIYLFKFCWAAIDVLIVSATKIFEKYTENFDTVRTVLHKEKRMLKELTDYHLGVRMEGWWIPRASYDSLIKNSKLRHRKEPPEEMSTTDLPNFLKLLKALWIITVARSDLLCYICVIMNQVMLCQLITIPLSIMVYMWGMLSNPRPSKTFWIIMIGYVELVILLKCIFHFEIMPGNTLSNLKQNYGPMDQVNPFFPSKFMGFLRMNYYYLWEMFTLMTILLHRHYLMNIGLWTTITTAVEASKGDGYYTMENGTLLKAGLKESSVSTKLRNLYVIRTGRSSILDNIVLSITNIFLHYASSLRQFSQRLMFHVNREPSDLYTAMFSFDFLAFLTVFLGYPDFFEYKSKDTVWTYFTTSVIPVGFVTVVVIHFIGILLDRAIYLKKSVAVKLVYHLLHTAFVHIWLFVLLPHLINGRTVIEKPAIVAYYIFRCIYLLISAHQIRIGYPSRIWGFYCFHGYGIWNYFNIRTYLIMPFLFELRSSFDWMLTDTTMSVFDWFKMEEIYTSVYKIKCLRRIEEEFSSPPGTMKKAIYKYLYGITVASLIIVLIWFPLTVYSWGRQQGRSNPPSGSTLRIQIGDTEPIYSNKGYSLSMKNFEFVYMLQVYNAYDVPKEFLGRYNPEDVIAMSYRTGAQSWTLRPQEQKRLLRIINSAHPVPITMSIKITLTQENGMKELNVQVKRMMFRNSTSRQNLAAIAEHLDVEGEITINYFMPKFLKVEQRGTVSMIDWMMHPDPQNNLAAYLRNMTMSAKFSVDGQGLWWEAKEEMEDANYIEFLQNLPHGSTYSDVLVIFVFSDKLVSAFFEVLTGGSILTFYSVFLIVIHGWSRKIISGRIAMLWLYEVPQADVIYAMCKEVFICREAGMWDLEEIAAGRVFFMMKSGETIIKLSRLHGNPYNPSTNKTLPSITRRS